MVHDKKKSGDPDFDDKVPAETHAGGKVVSAGDGRELFVSDAVGPVNPDGSHAAIDKSDAEQGDNRPAPGDVATEASEAQVFDPADAPGGGPITSGAKAPAKRAASSSK